MRKAEEGKTEKGQVFYLSRRARRRHEELEESEEKTLPVIRPSSSFYVSFVTVFALFMLNNSIQIPPARFTKGESERGILSSLFTHCFPPRSLRLCG
jgi:hypothetical protein